MKHFSNTGSRCCLDDVVVSSFSAGVGGRDDNVDAVDAVATS